MNNTLFFSYLTGLIEGDGTIYVPLTHRNSKGKINYPNIQISFSKPDYVLALTIQKTLKTGSIHKKKKASAYVYTINSPTSLQKLIPLLSPYWRTPKINKFNLLAEYYGISPVKIDQTNLLNNAWLSGFIEADGSFYVRYLTKTEKTEAQFMLEQREKDVSGGSLESIMSEIAEKLEVNLKKTNRISKNSTYRIRTTSLRTNKILIKYLTKYPLWGEKYLNFKSFEEVVKLFERKEHLKSGGKEIIIRLKEQMNTKRTFYNWDHLSDFYKIEYDDKI